MSKLYRVKEEAIRGNSGESRANRGIVRDNGWLWVFEGEWEGGHDTYKAYRSVATGHTSPFADYELEEVE